MNEVVCIVGSVGQQIRMDQAAAIIDQIKRLPRVRCSLRPRRVKRNRRLAARRWSFIGRRCLRIRPTTRIVANGEELPGRDAQHRSA